MGRKAKAGGAGSKAKQSSLLGGGFDFAAYPQLKKLLEVVGKAIDVPGSFWDKYRAAYEQFLASRISQPASQPISQPVSQSDRRPASNQLVSQPASQPKGSLHALCMPQR